MTRSSTGAAQDVETDPEAGQLLPRLVIRVDLEKGRLVEPHHGRLELIETIQGGTEQVGCCCQSLIELGRVAAGGLRGLRGDCRLVGRDPLAEHEYRLVDLPGEFGEL